MWFEDLTGFYEETSPAGREEIYRNISVERDQMTMWNLGRIRICGRLETPSIASLRQQLESSNQSKTRSDPQFSEVVADVQDLHCDPRNAGALFQVASQFNLLEMVSPDVCPEDGVSRYALDRTQGPACAIACGAGTIYRNYFAPIGPGVGQTEEHQINCLADLGARLGNIGDRLWKMRNGYALATEQGLSEITSNLASITEYQRDELVGSIRVGLHWGTEVTLRPNPSGQNHLVTQAYCSALPVAYSDLPGELWQPFASVVLDAAYEATILAAALNNAETGNNTVYLTMLGGGAFGNETDWIMDAMKRAIRLPAARDLNIILVSYNSPSGIEL